MAQASDCQIRDSAPGAERLDGAGELRGVEPVAQENLLGRDVDAPVHGGQQLAELALGLGLGAARGDVLAPTLSERVPAGVNGQFPGSRATLSDGAFHALLFPATLDCAVNLLLFQKLEWVFG